MRNVHHIVTAIFVPSLNLIINIIQTMNVLVTVLLIIRITIIIYVSMTVLMGIIKL